MTDLTQSDLKTYSADQVASLADVDVYAVRAEGERRQAAAEKKLETLRKRLAKAEADLAGSHIILKAAFAEMAKQ